MVDEFIGKTVGGYEIEAKLGQGGMATVYRARQTSMNRTVALKVLPRHFMKDDTYLQRFEREVKIVAQLEHRNIISVYDYGEYDGQPYIAMRYMSAGTIDDLLVNGPLPMDQILSVFEQIAPALDYAHSKNVLHRDLKPSNVLLDDNEGAYITDFGIARITGAESQGTTITTQGVVGTPSYMSPEQAQGHTLDGRSDIYSLGVMLFEMTTGRRPFENETPYGIAVMQVTTPPPQPRGINPEISAAVEKVTLKSLSKNPENRHATAVLLAEALKQAIERPESIHDTQPRPIQIGDQLQHTQPSSASQNTVSSSAINPVPSVPQMRPQFNPSTNTGSQPMRPPQLSGRLKKRKQSRGMMTGIIVGGVIGCGLLTVIVIALAYTLGDFLSGDDSNTAQVDTTEDSGLNLPTLDAASQTERANVVGGQGEGDDATPTLIPVGARPTAASGNTYALDNARIIYFALRDEEDEDDSSDSEDERVQNYDIYYYDFASETETRLTDSSAVDSYPMASPDGEKLVFQSNRDGDFDIYVMNIDGSDVVQVTDSDVLDRLPAWSPDGDWIVYSSDTADDGNYDLYRIRADGAGVPELLLTNGARNSHPRYSPDGRYVVYTTGPSDNALAWEVARLDIQTGEVLTLTNNDVRDASPNFSPDGQTVLFTTDGDGGSALATINVDGSGEVTIVEDHLGREWGGYYSPDGAHVIYNSEQGIVSEIYYFPANGGDRILVEGEGGFYPSWVP